MEKKKYSSYAELERDLEILKLEKEINYQKLVLSFQKTKERYNTAKNCKWIYFIVHRKHSKFICKNYTISFTIYYWLVYQ